MELALNTFVTLVFFAPMALMVAANLATLRAPGCPMPVLLRAALPDSRGSTGEAANDPEILEAA